MKTIMFHGVNLRMSLRLWLALLSLTIVLLIGKNQAGALTPEEVLKLKQAGVSDETIQMMIEQEQERRIPSNMIEQGYATDHPGSWKLRDGRTITSTGKRQLPLPYPTEYPVAPNIYPYVVTPPIRGWRATPSTPVPPKDPTLPR
jgi:hypothetical protein